MRISDWSSDVCSSDLPNRMHGHVDETELQLRVPARAQLSPDAVSADISVTDTSGSIDAKSVSGDVQLVVGSGEVKASTVRGAWGVQAPAYQPRLTHERVTVRSGKRGSVRVGRGG